MTKKWIRGISLAILAFLIAGCDRPNDKLAVVDTSQDENPAESAHYEQLKNLEWLVGNWKDDEKDVDITYSTEWSMNHNFIVQRFNSDLGDHDEIQGDQVIGWDPAEKKIRSWVFDSDGGFGESIWTEDGATWYSAMKFTLPDGRKATASHIYAKTDNDSYTFTSTNRDVDGELLPDIGPIKIIRTK